MPNNKYLEKESLVRNSFLWSEARLVIAAIALFMGGTPPLYTLLPDPATFGLVSFILTLSWLISGIASVYLVYRWHADGWTLFGKEDTKDKIAFFVSVISGVNLGATGILGRNIGMSILSGSGVFVITGLIYLVTAFYLYRRWRASGQKLFR